MTQCKQKCLTASIPGAGRLNSVSCPAAFKENRWEEITTTTDEHKPNLAAPPDVDWTRAQLDRLTKPRRPRKDGTMESVSRIHWWSDRVHVKVAADSSKTRFGPKPAATIQCSTPAPVFFDVKLTDGKGIRVPDGVRNQQNDGRRAYYGMGGPQMVCLCCPIEGDPQLGSSELTAAVLVGSPLAKLSPVIVGTARVDRPTQRTRKRPIAGA